MPARFCSQCGQEVAPVAKFCPNCASPLPTTDNATGMPVSGPTNYGAPFVPRVAETRTDDNRKRAIIFGVASVVVCLIAVIVLAAKLSQRSLLAQRTQVTAAPSILAAPSLPAPAPNVLSAQSAPVAAPALMNAKPAAAGQLPPDVAQYMQFLQGVEQKRLSLSNDMSSAAMMMTTAKQMQAGASQDPSQHNAQVPGDMQKVNSGFSDISTKFQALAGQFNAQRPPNSCAALANAYGQFLSGYVGTISKLQVALVSGDIGAAMGLQGEQSQITSSGIEADNQLGQVYSHYGVPKAFDIKPDGASSSVLGM